MESDEFVAGEYLFLFGDVVFWILSVRVIIHTTQHDCNNLTIPYTRLMRSPSLAHKIKKNRYITSTTPRAITNKTFIPQCRFPLHPCLLEATFGSFLELLLPSLPYLHKNRHRSHFHHPLKMRICRGYHRMDPRRPNDLILGHSRT